MHCLSITTRCWTSLGEHHSLRCSIHSHLTNCISPSPPLEPQPRSRLSLHRTLHSDWLRLVTQILFSMNLLSLAALLCFSALQAHLVVLKLLQLPRSRSQPRRRQATQRSQAATVSLVTADTCITNQGGECVSGTFLLRDCKFLLAQGLST